MASGQGSKYAAYDDNIDHVHDNHEDNHEDNGDSVEDNIDEQAGSESAALMPEKRAPVTSFSPSNRFRTLTYILTGSTILLLAANVYLSLPYAWRGRTPSLEDSSCRPSDVPQYFQTDPNLWPGPTATGPAAFLAQTRVLNPTSAFVPNEPLQTVFPLKGAQDGPENNIFKMMGYLSPYSPSPGFGVNEYSLPRDAEIVQVQMLSRHGARYPTTGSDVEALGGKIAEASGMAYFLKRLEFLTDWKYQLGKEVLVPKGRQELYDSGVLHAYMYGHLYNPNTKLIVRTTTQDRMLRSAENWLAGFFGLGWTSNATIEVIIEQPGFNNSLGGGLNCPNAWPKGTGPAARDQWVKVYLQDAIKRFQEMTHGFEWTASDVFAAQSLCPYETVAYGYSRFCDLFTWEEWRDFGYASDLFFAGSSGFQSPAGRAVGIGYQQEVMARLHNHTLGYSGSQINVTLDSSTETFPLNQSLYFDFSHDTNIASVLTAFGLTQFAQLLPADKHPGDHPWTIAHVTPFGARLDIEIIRTPFPVGPRRGYMDGGETKYVHFVLNQRTLPLGKSFPECDENRDDGWCELETFMKIQDAMTEKAQFEKACFGDYPDTPYGKISDGVPPA